ncbi:MAG: phosphatidylserine decarboxylase [Alkaliphilus sp.]|nr:phosphatidylserine decarboxylase [bacterium AH-315-L21]PHS29733.1 MAG: phosphatidylserine decarboxylase [Alkaliphilus sp.]
MSIYYIDRKDGQVKQEEVAAYRMLKWTYETRVGKTLLELLIKKKIFSSFLGLFMETKLSKRKIDSFVNSLRIEMSEAEREKTHEYKNFNDFFARKLKAEARPVCQNDISMISPVDGRLLAYENIDLYSEIEVKGERYKLLDIFQDSEMASEFDSGTCVIARLSPIDYHRFHFPDNGSAHESKRVKGYYYSVNPLTMFSFIDVYCRNKREITKFDSDNFGEMCLVEVGATAVGSIVQTYQANSHIEKGAEKGYFKFGGSTVIMFIKKNKIVIDRDIIRNTDLGYETKVNIGERIGLKYKMQKKSTDVHV